MYWTLLSMDDSWRIFLRRSNMAARKKGRRFQFKYSAGFKIKTLQLKAEMDR